MSSFFECFAHEGDPLSNHLSEVAKNAVAEWQGMESRVRHAVLLMGLLHDVGKATPWFQDRVQGRTKAKDRLSNHATLSALVANWVIDHVSLPHQEKTWIRYAVVAGIAKHHTNLTTSLADIVKELRQEFQTDSVYRKQVERMHMMGFFDWLSNQLRRYDLPFEPAAFSFEGVLQSINQIRPLFDSPFRTFEDGLDFLVAFGSLVGSDKMHAAFPDWQGRAYDLDPNLVSTYRTRRFGPPKSELDKIRERIFDEILTTAKGNARESFYTITAPTGSGKTLAGLAAGLALKRSKESHSRSRLIYCLPFTSIIDQNEAEYRHVLKESGYDPESDLLLTHHHLTDLSYRTGEEDVEDGAELLVETWQSDIVITTFYQFLYTLFSSRNRNLKRVPALKNAVVILDEVQAIPHRYWEDVRRFFQYAHSKLDTTFVLMTATMPLILNQQEAVELLPSHTKYFQSLSRTRIVNRTGQPTKFDELKDLLRAEIDGDPQISRIVILNRRKPVKELYRYVCDYVSQCCKNINVHMLSTDLTPFDRRQVLDRLHPPFILVTTQVVEAGVNISAPQVWRDIAPLDAIIQSAGRCNRNWERNEGEVRLVQLVTDHGRMAVPPYDGFLVQTTLDVLAGKNEILEQEFYSLAQRYYRLLRQRSEPTRLQEIMANGDIHKIDGPEGFVLIEERPSQSYFIIRDDAGRRIWDEYTALLNIRDFFARRRAFNKIRREFMERIVQQPTQGRTGEIIPVYPDDRKYSETTGLENMDDGYMIL